MDKPASLQPCTTAIGRPWLQENRRRATRQQEYEKSLNCSTWVELATEILHRKPWSKQAKKRPPSTLPSTSIPMGLFSFLRSVYDLDTLDTRFTTPSTVPYKTVIDSRDEAYGKGSSSTRPNKGGAPSKWRTAEFYFYYLIFLLAVPYMFWTAYDVSRESDPRYPKYEHLLSEGWIPGRKIVSVGPPLLRRSTPDIGL